MARYICDGKIFDTDTSSKLCTYRYMGMGTTTLMVTKKGTYWSHNYYPFGNMLIKVHTEEEVKELLITNAEVAVYEELFGKLEEA